MQSHKWNEMIASFPDPHILQTWQWGQVKANFGWEPDNKIWGSETNPDAVALVLKRVLPFNGVSIPFSIFYVPKGPLIRDWDDLDLVRQVFDDLKAAAQGKGAIFVKIDPDVPFGRGVPGEENQSDSPIGTRISHELMNMGWIYSDEQIQYRNTVLLDLALPEDEILANMKQKTRYNIRLADRKGVVVRAGSKADFELLYKMYAETSLRDEFAIRDADYYYCLWGLFMTGKQTPNDEFAQPSCEPLIAEVEGQPVAAIVVFYFAGKAYYLHGMSLPLYRNLMPNYLLQWEAITRAKANGCLVYDLWGAPEVFDENDPMWGVYRFKDGFGGVVLRTIGAYDLPLRPFYYSLYTKILPRIFEWTRNKGITNIKRFRFGNGGG
jgi:lipid II:glycine glycyltransferase (peptidoglycan interpeptide bridge formation enzyme)